MGGKGLDEYYSQVKCGKVCFNYQTNKTKYYLLTEGSGYPLAEFSFPNLSARQGTGLVVPENRSKTANIILGTDSTRPTQ